MKDVLLDAAKKSLSVLLMAATVSAMFSHDSLIPVYCLVIFALGLIITSLLIRRSHGESGKRPLRTSQETFGGPFEESEDASETPLIPHAFPDADSTAPAARKKVFDYDSFPSLSLVFNRIRGKIVPPVQKARVVLYAATASRFANLRAFMPTVKPLFTTASTKLIKAIGVVADITPAQAPVRDALVAIREAAKEITTRLRRPILSLKVARDKLVSLAPTLRRNSSTADFAAALKAEKLMIEKAEKKAASPETATTLEDAFTAGRRRHPLADKPFSELFARLEEPKQSKFHNVSIAELMKAAERESRAALNSLNEMPPTPQFKAASERKVASPQPQQPSQQTTQPSPPPRSRRGLGLAA
jgi:hypothetical protein